MIRFQGGLLSASELPCPAHGQAREGDIWYLLVERTQVICTTAGDGVLGWMPLNRVNAEALLKYHARISLASPLTARSSGV